LIAAVGCVLLGAPAVVAQKTSDPAPFSDKYYEWQLGGAMLAFDSDVEAARVAAIDHLSRFPETKGELFRQAVAKPGSLERLIGSIGHEDAFVRRGVCRILATLGVHAKAAAPALTRALRDRDPIVRATAAEALGGLGESAATSVVELVRALRSETDGYARAVLAKALGQLGAHAESAVPELIDGLRSKDSTLKLRAAMALAELGPVARPALPELRAALI